VAAVTAFTLIRRGRPGTDEAEVEAGDEQLLVLAAV
jgi:hypothetical protein